MVKKSFTRILCLALAVLFLVSTATFFVSADVGTEGSTDPTRQLIEEYLETANNISYGAYMLKYKDAFEAAGTKTGTEEQFFFDATTGWIHWSGGINSYGQGKGNSVSVENGEWVMKVTEQDADGKTRTVEYRRDEIGDDVYGRSARPVNYDGKNAVYSPSTGTIAWTLDLAAAGITEPGLYSISLVYYPVEGKATSIEREFFINHEVPFAETRSITLVKRWESFLQSGSEYTVMEATYVPSSKKIRNDPEKLQADLAAVKAEAEKIGLSTRYSSDASSLLIAQPEIVTGEINAFLDQYGLRFFEQDDNRNELRPAMQQSPEWMTYTLRDSNGYYANDFGYWIDPGENGTITVSLKGVNEPMALCGFILTPYTTYRSYEQYLADLKAGGASMVEGTDKIKLEGEYTTGTSTNVVYPVEDRASALTSPCDTTRTLLNTIGTEKWETSGQWVEYKFKVNASGLYDIYARFKQSYLDGLFVSRSLRIYTNYENLDAYKAAHGGKSAGYYNGVPFAEAAELRFDYGSNWQVTSFTNAQNAGKKGQESQSFEFYFEKDVEYTITLEVTLGSMNENVIKLEAILNALNNDYLDIIKYTGSSPDPYADYEFIILMPNTIIDMIMQARALKELSAELKKNTASTYTGICDKLADLLEKMGADEENIAPNLSNFKSYVGSLGTFLTDAKTQPLQLDYLTIQGRSEQAPKANGNFFVNLWHEIVGFVQSFFRDYNSMGAKKSDQSLESVNVWLAYGRDQAQVLRNLATNDFTTKTGIAVNLKLVTGGTLLPSILAGVGPDVYLGLGQADVINYAIRGALINIDDMEGFDEVAANFNDAAMVVLRMDDENGDSHCYGLPETQLFPMMFIRTDILSGFDNINLETWDGLYTAQKDLKAKNMEIGVTTSYKMFLYQMGGELFADNGMRINLDSQVGLDSFEKMCNMFTEYSFPYSYNAANRFRSGEMPIVISDYTTLYNQLKVFATELDGCWTFVPLPGIVGEDGTINNCSVSSVTAAVMIKGKKNIERNLYGSEAEYKAALKEQYGTAWEFTKWYTDAPCQVEYATEMVAIMGDSAKHSTANREALKAMPWTEAERKQVEAQFENLASIPNYPGYYYIDRYTNFAFLAAYNDGANPRTELRRYINTINKEITRKREEFNLETLEIGQTLVDKRSGQVSEALELLAEKYGANQAGNKYNDAYKAALYGIANRTTLQLRETVLIQLRDAAVRFAGTLDSGNGVVTGAVTERLNPADASQRASFATLKAQDWFIYVSKQTTTTKNSGYEIESLSEKELVYFITECLCNIVCTLQSY